MSSHIWIYELKVTDVGSYGFFASVELCEKEMRKNAIMWETRLPCGLMNIYRFGNNTTATIYPHAVFTEV